MSRIRIRRWRSFSARRSCSGADNPEVQKTNWYLHPEISLMDKQSLPMERLKNDSEFAHGSDRNYRCDDDGSEFQGRGDHRQRDSRGIHQIRSREFGQDEDILYQKLVEEYDSLRSEIEGREKLIARLCNELGTSTPNDLVSQKRIRLDEAEAKLQSLDQDIALAVWQEKQMEELGQIHRGKRHGHSTEP